MGSRQHYFSRRLIKKRRRVKMTELEILVPNVLFINLEHRKDRLAEFYEEMAKISFADNQLTRIDAIYVPHNGMLGCALSHIKAIEMAKEKKWPYVAVFEDDFCWREHVDKEKLVQLLSDIFDKKTFWDVFLLSCNPQCDEQIDFIHGATRCLFAFTTSGYIVQEHYYDTLLENFRDAANLLKVTIVDAEKFAIDRHWTRLQAADRWLRACPTLGKQRASFSDIRGLHVDYKC